MAFTLTGFSIDGGFQQDKSMDALMPGWGSHEFSTSTPFELQGFYQGTEFVLKHVLPKSSFMDRFCEGKVELIRLKEPVNSVFLSMTDASIVIYLSISDHNAGTQ